MSPWLTSFVAVLVVSGVPLLVTLLMARRESVIRHLLPQFSAFGAGAVLGAALVHLIPDALRQGQSWPRVVIGVAVGFVVFWLIERALAQHDHAHAHGMALGAPSAHDSASSAAQCVHLQPTPPHSHAHVVSSRTLVPMTFVGDAAHNLVDGMLIAAGFLADPTVGVLTVIAVGLHELPREIGTFGVFVHSGVRPMRAVAYNALTGVVAMAGAAVTLAVGTKVAGAATGFLPVAAGTYVYIAQVVGRSALVDGPGQPRQWGRLLWLAGGIVAMVGTSFVE